MTHRNRKVTTSTMKRRIRRFVFWSAWWGVALVGVMLALPVAGQDAASRIQAEVDRLQQLLAKRPVSFPGNPDANKGASDALKSALKDQSAGRLYRSLEEFGQVADFVHGVWTVMDNGEATKGSLPAFEAAWEKSSASVAALDRQAQAANRSDARAAIEALSETAQAMSTPLLEGGRAFAVSTEPKDGLFNVGEAEGQAEFAAFVASLRLPRTRAAYPFHSLLPEIESFQLKENVAFKPPRSIDQHMQFMMINSALKQARELDATKCYAGALYQYLLAVGYYGMLDAAPQDSSQQAALKSALATARQKLEASQRDDSIAEIFLERAESQLAHVDGSAPSADDWKIVKVITDQVLSAYYAADHPLAGPQTASGKAVEITLVRWPYT